MCGTKCPTVRSGGTTSVRSAVMPTLMMSRASIGGSEIARSFGRTPDPCRVMAHWSRDADAVAKQSMPVLTGSCSRCAKLRTGQGRRAERAALLLRRGGALHKGLAALHLVRERSFV